MDGIGLILLAIAIWWLARFFAPRPGPPRRLPEFPAIEELGEVERVFHTPYDWERDR